MALSDHYPEMEGWVPAKPAAVPAAPAIPDPTTQVNPYLRTTLPLMLQYQPDTLKQFNRPGISSFRVAPLPPNALPTINAAATGIATQVSTTIVDAAIAAIPDIESIGINKQTGTSYTLQPSDVDTLVTFDNVLGGAITLPSPNGTQTAGSTVSAFVDGAVAEANFSALVSLKLAQGTASDLAIVAFSGQVDALGTPSGWTGLIGSGGTETFLSQQLVGTTPLSLSVTLPTGPQTWTGCMATFRSSGTTVVTNRGGISGAFSSGTSFSVNAPITAGNAMILLIGTNGGPATDALAFGVSDTQGNPWKRVTAADNFYIAANGSPLSQHVQIWSTPVGLGGTPTLTLSITLGLGNTVTAANCSVYEVSGLSSTGPVSGLPANWFTYLENTSSGTFGVGSLSKIDEINQTVQLTPNTGMLVVYDGTNYYTVRGIAALPLTFAAIANSFLNSYNSATGVFTAKQPDFTNLSGTALVPQGGTGATTLTAHGVVVAEGTAAFTATGAGTAGQVLTSNGAALDPTFQPTLVTQFNQSIRVDTIVMSDDYWLAVDANAPDWILPLTST
jgi:hypothetical protein